MVNRDLEKEMAERLVEEGKARFKLQRQLIAKLRSESNKTELAQELLTTLEAMQIAYEEQVEQLDGHLFSESSLMWR